MVDHCNHLPSAQHEPGTVAQHEPGRVHSTSDPGRGRLEPDIWNDETDPAMVIDVEHGADIADVPALGLVP